MKFISVEKERPMVVLPAGWRYYWVDGVELKCKPVIGYIETEVWEGHFAEGAPDIIVREFTCVIDGVIETIDTDTAKSFVAILGPGEELGMCDGVYHHDGRVWALVDAPTADLLSSVRKTVDSWPVMA